MKSKSIILVAICLIVIGSFSGCTEEEVVEEEKGLNLYVGGTDGVVGKFTHPANLYEGQTFDLNFEVANKGEEAILDGELHVYMSGVTWKSYGAVALNDTELNNKTSDTGGFVNDLFYDDITSPDSIYGGVLPVATTDMLWMKACYTDTPDDCVYKPVHNYLKDRNLLVDSNFGELTPVEKSPTGEALPGGTDELLYYDLDLSVPDNTQGQSIPWGATMCYPYKARGAAQVCVGQVDVRGDVAGQCEPNGDKDTDSSGGPIQITKITETTSQKGKVHAFTIHFENKGSGEPYTKELLNGENCISDVSIAEKGRVIVENITLDGEPIPAADLVSCKFGKEGGKWVEQRLTGKEGIIKCRINGGEAVAGFATLEVTLRYNYYDSSLTKEYTIEGF